MATAMAVIGLGGGILKSVTQLSAGQKEQEAFDYNAGIAEQEAELIKQGADLDEYRSRKRLKSFTGEQIASYAKSGVELTGSPLDVIQDSIANAELEISIDRFNSETAASKKKSEAKRGRQYGKDARTSSYLKAGGTLLSTAGDFGSKFYTPKKKKIGD